MKCSGKKLKDWKANMKKNYYKNHLSFDEQKHYKDSRVYADQWEHLIKYWAIEEVKAQSDKNKASRAERKYNHTTGTKSFPRVRKEQKTMIDEMNERTTLNANLSNKGPNDAFGQVMGKEKHGRVRMYGLGVSPSNLWRDTSGHKANHDTTMDVMDAENSELRSKVSHVQHAPNNLTNTSNQATTTSTPLDMAARHQAWSLSSIQDTSLTQVGDIVVLKSIIRPTETVAIGVLKSTDASKEVEGEELGPDYWEVHVQVPIKPNESLIRSYGLVKTIGQAIGAHVAWPAPFVISQVMDASREYLYK
ncbi:unnamed protein product [Camellia sinensis]